MYKKICNQLEKDIGKKRYEHSLRTAEFARELAKLNGVDEEKAYLAGLLHDCGKWKDEERLYKEVLKREELSDYWGEKSKKVLHAHFGVIVAREEYGIDDEEILSAIKYHGTGRANMTKLEKVVYVADTYERGRDYPDINRLRALAIEDLDLGLLEGLIYTINKLIKEKQYIDQNTIFAYNYIISERGGVC